MPFATGRRHHAASGPTGGIDWEVDSAGTGGWHVGKAPDRRSVRAALDQGIDISRQVCRLFREEDFDTFDLILVMDRNNLTDVLSMARNDNDRQKVKLLLGDETVPDPYYDDSQFAPVYRLIAAGCREIIRQYQK